jgi:hypothetical protein
MTEPSEGRVCPPHHWEVTIVRTDGAAVHHHLCLRCQAQKDVPIGQPAQPKPWRL